MANSEKYIKAFTDTFNVEEETAKGLKYHEIPDWDSVGHMSLVMALEETFNITMSPEDIVDFNSFESGLKILGEQYDVEF